MNFLNLLKDVQTLVYIHEINFNLNPRKHEVLLIINLNCLIYRCLEIEVALVFTEKLKTFIHR